MDTRSGGAVVSFEGDAADGGEIRVDTGPGGGTTVSGTLPAAGDRDV